MFRFKLAEDNKPGPALYLKGKIKAWPTFSDLIVRWEKIGS